MRRFLSVLCVAGVAVAIFVICGCESDNDSTTSVLPAAAYSGTWTGNKAHVYLGASNTLYISITVLTNGTASLMYGPGSAAYGPISGTVTNGTVVWSGNTYHQTTFATAAAGTHTWVGATLTPTTAAIPIAKQ